MFDDLIRTLRSLDDMQLSLSDPAEPDADGYIDRQCPATECEFAFKVREEDWRDIVRDEAVWCPFCGHERPADEWLTHQQAEKLEEAALVLGISRATASRHWRYARAWLYDALSRG